MLTKFPAVWEKLLNGFATTIVGHREVIEDVLVCLFAGGHCLLESAPGMGKTLLAKTLSALVDCQFSRIQFTPDLMPADITGVNILQENTNGKRELVFRRGALFAQLVLADEINRATPKTQAALLEAMQENSITINGETHRLRAPFMVIATQNSIEMEGTYPLPEAQLDRFFYKIFVPTPQLNDLQNILANTTSAPLPLPEKIITAAEVVDWQKKIREVLVAETALALATKIVLATNPHNELSSERVKKYVRYGVSPRGAQALILSAKVRALSTGKVHIANEDIIKSALPALRHRIILNFAGEAENISNDELIREVVEKL